MGITILSTEDEVQVGAVDWEATARAVLNPIAVAVLELLAVVDRRPHPERSPKQLADALGEADRLGLVAYHVRMLADRGLVELVRTEQRRGALAHYYRLTPAARASARQEVPA